MNLQQLPKKGKQQRLRFVIRADGFHENLGHSPILLGRSMAKTDLSRRRATATLGQHAADCLERG